MPPLVGLGCVVLAIAIAHAYGIPSLLIGFGSLLLAIALAFLLEGSGWGIAIPCAIASGLALLCGVFRVRALLPRRSASGR